MQYLKKRKETLLLFERERGETAHWTVCQKGYDFRKNDFNG